jgi:hypothetical protein
MDYSDAFQCAPRGDSFSDPSRSIQAEKRQVLNVAGRSGFLN